MTATLQPSSPSLQTPLAADQTRFRDSIKTALRGALKHSRSFERRYSDRHPYPYPIHITPLSRDGETLVDQSFVVIGRHLSEQGVDFYHREPIPYRTVLASLQIGPKEWLGLTLDLTWCRFRFHGLYENGGRFLRLAESPLANGSLKT